jgi:hypothetical protein
MLLVVADTGPIAYLLYRFATSCATRPRLRPCARGRLHRPPG